MNDRTQSTLLKSRTDSCELGMVKNDYLRNSVVLDPLAQHDGGNREGSGGRKRERERGREGERERERKREREKRELLLSCAVGSMLS